MGSLPSPGKLSKFSEVSGSAQSTQNVLITAYSQKLASDSVLKWCHDTQHYNLQHHETQHNNKKTGHSAEMTRSITLLVVKLSVIVLGVAFFIVMLTPSTPKQ